MCVLFFPARVVLILYDDRIRLSLSVLQFFVLTPSVLNINKLQLLMTSLNLSLWQAASKRPALQLHCVSSPKNVRKVSKKRLRVLILHDNS